jgi:hypothetical protein
MRARLNWVNKLECLTAFVVSFVILLSAHPTHSQTQIEILSKEDTRAVFAMNREQWERNSEAIIAQGRAIPWRIPGEVTGIIIEQPGGMSVWTRPLYENAESPKPMALQVLTAYREPLAGTLADRVLREAVVEARRQLAPEYHVDGKVERVPQGVFISFMILEQHSN